MFSGVAPAAAAQDGGPNPCSNVTGHCEVRLDGDIGAIIYLTFWTSEGRLFCSQQGNPEILELIEIDAEALAFYGEDTDKRRYDFEFTTNDGGEVTQCILTTGEKKSEAAKTGDFLEDGNPPGS